MTLELRQERFRDWLDVMDLEWPRDRKRIQRLLCKSERMVNYYHAGYPIPLDTQVLMTALADGYKPRPWYEAA